MGKKNETEIEQVRLAMIKDGVAITRFLIWIEQNIGKIKKRVFQMWIPVDQLQPVR